jgi:DNA-binding NarL/FixJ family response regulator
VRVANYDLAARLAHLLASRALAVAAIERSSSLTDPYIKEAWDALTNELAETEPAGRARHPDDAEHASRNGTGWGIDRIRSNAPARAQVVVDAAARGLTNPEIAATLNLTINTVKTHLRLAMQELGVTNRAQLAHLLR